MRSRANALIVTSAALCCLLSAAEAGDATVEACLYSFTVGAGKTRVAPCEGDTQRIGSDEHVLRVLALFDISRDAVLFKACPGGRFAASQDYQQAGRYVVKYPADIPANFLAPIVHELAHLVQMRKAGGLAALDPAKNSKRIELGADFLAGLAFKMALSRLNDVDFERNLHLIGAYKILFGDHGKPEDRTAAFRLGFTRSEPYNELSISESLDYFNKNQYQQYFQ